MNKQQRIGANKERKAVLAKVRRMKAVCGGIISGGDLVEWLLQRVNRYNKKAGGL